MLGFRIEFLLRRKFFFWGICVIFEERGFVWKKYIEVYEIYNVNFRNFFSFFVFYGKYFLFIKIVISKFFVEGDFNV